MTLQMLTMNDGIEIAVDAADENGKPVLILSNSIGTSMAMWAPQIPAFSEAFRLIRYDTRGHGKSGVPTGETSIDRLGQDVLSIADQLGIGSFLFCGMSMGGMTGFWLAINASERVTRVVVADAAPFAGGPAMWSGRIETIEREGLEALMEGTIARWLTPDFMVAHPDVVAAVRDDFAATSGQGYASCVAAIRDLDLRPHVKEISVPMLLIAGEHDAGPPPQVLEGLSKIIPDARYICLPAAHLTNIEAADAFTAAVVEFLG